MKNFVKCCCFFLSVLAISSCQNPKVPETTENPAPHPLLGSWEMASVHWISADTTYSVAQAQPGIFMFDSVRYSIQWTPTETKRTPWANLSEPTDEETIAGFRSVVFNAGTHSMTDSTLTTTAKIAKVPGFEGGIQYYRFKIEGDQLELTMFDETYPDGQKPKWSGKWQTKFVMHRAK